MENMELSLADIFRKFFLRWKLLIVMIIVGALLGVLIGGMLSERKVQKAQTAFLEQVQKGGPAEGEEWVTVPEAVSFSIKYVVFGVAGGVFADICLVALSYALSSKLRCADDMATGFGVSVIGTVDAPHKAWYRFSDRFINRCFSAEKYLPADTKNEILATDITLAARKHGLKKICLMGNCDDAVKQNVLDRIHADPDTKVYIEGLAIYSPAALASMLSADGVVLFEEEGRAHFADIKKELEYCKRYGIAVLGCVIVQ